MTNPFDANQVWVVLCTNGHTDTRLLNKDAKVGDLLFSRCDKCNSSLLVSHRPVTIQAGYRILVGS